MVSIAPYRSDLRTQILDLLGDREAREPIWSWQFEQRPGGHDFAPVVACSTDGSVAGFNGAMPVRMLEDGRTRNACWSCDFFVREDMRGTGVAQTVKRALHARYPYLITFGVSPVAARVLGRMGWQTGTAVHSYRRLGRSRRWKDVVMRSVQAALRLAALPRALLNSPARSLDVAVSDHLPNKEDIEDLWAHVGPSYHRIVCRDHAYLSWRYQRCPVGRYWFLIVRQHGELRALGVYRNGSETTRLVDMVAHADDRAAREAIVDHWLDSPEPCEQAQVVTSDRVLGRVLRAHGFYRNQHRPRFFARTTETRGNPAAGWFLMAGDSDGEFLAAARERATQRTAKVAVSDPADTLRVAVLHEQEAFGQPRAWRDLVGRSDADPLFMGWAWQSAWWRTWGYRLRLQPFLLGVFHGDTLVGLAPLYLHRDRRHLPYRRKQLHFVGNAWQVAPTVRTEYTDFIIDSQWHDSVLRAVRRFLDRADWDLAVICDYVQTETAENIRAAFAGTQALRKRDYGVCIDTSHDFEGWLRGLGPNTRLKAYNRRRYITRHYGEPQVQHVADPERFLELLNDFHRRRWGKPCFEGPSLDFHRAFLSTEDPSRRPRLTSLTIDGEVRSVLYDVQVGDRVYNLQAGFDDSFDPKVSLGTLHLGYAIETAFSEPSVRAYDLLAGRGKNTFYKERFHGRQVVFDTVQVFRHPVLRTGYAVYGRLPSRLRPRAARWAQAG